MKIGRFFVLAALVLAAPAVRAASDSVVDLGAVELLPQEIGRFQVRIGCAPGSDAGPPSICRSLAAAAPTLAFKMLDQPAGLDDGDRLALRTSATPMTTVLGSPLTEAAALAHFGAQICGRHIFVPGAVDQYGAPWTLAPYMYKVDGQWAHGWSVRADFAGYKTSIVDGSPQVTVIQTREELEAQRGSRWNLFNFLPGNPFEAR